MWERHELWACNWLASLNHLSMSLKARWAKLSRLEKIVIIAFANSLVIFLGFLFMDKAQNRDFLVPEGYEGWVCIRYAVPDAAPLPELGGVQQLRIPAGGYLETSSRLAVGWRRDRYFWYDSTGTTRIPGSVDLGAERGLHLFQHQYFAQSYEALLPSLPVGTDTLLPEGTHIKIESAGRVDYTPGPKTLEYFYVSRAPRSLMYIPPPPADHQGLQSTFDREIPVR